jgi:hypothetical protein
MGEVIEGKVMPYFRLRWARFQHRKPWHTGVFLEFYKKLENGDLEWKRRSAYCF